MTPPDIARQMEGCMDTIRRYAPSTTSGNPPLPDPQRLRDVADTLMDIADDIESGKPIAEVAAEEVLESDRPQEGTMPAPFQP